TAGKRRWQIPAYPVNIRDVTGAGDAFSGAFLTGLVETQDPVEAALRGAVSASIIIEGLGGLSALDVTPGLPRARLEALRGNVRRV
ncbi:MAG: carbohydrate kinase, partial [Chloroflexi bacterium]|nr:carbohydrate kinase [Chloroflexota bacterium]